MITATHLQLVKVSQRSRGKRGRRKEGEEERFYGIYSVGQRDEDLGKQRQSASRVLPSCSGRSVCILLRLSVDWAEPTYVTGGKNSVFCPKACVHLNDNFLPKPTKQEVFTETSRITFAQLPKLWWHNQVEV